jgi:hypothetical protein
LKGSIHEAEFSQKKISIEPNKSYLLGINNYVYVKEPGRESKIISPADVLKFKLEGEQRSFSPRESTPTIIRSLDKERTLLLSAEYLKPANTGNIPFAGEVFFATVNENSYVQEVKIELKEVDKIPQRAREPRKVIGNVVIPDDFPADLKGTERVRKQAIEYWRNDPNGQRIQRFVGKVDKAFGVAEKKSLDVLKKAPEKTESFWDKAFNREIGEVTE